MRIDRLARRLVERGVRFAQFYYRGWDMHGATACTDIATMVPELCLETDRAATALACGISSSAGSSTRR